MCLGLGFGFALGLIEVLPYFCLVSAPVLGSFCGLDTIYRLSIILIVHAILLELIPEILVRVMPVLNLLLFSLLLYLPVSITPWPVLWLLDLVVWASNPIFMISEVVLVQNFVMRRSQMAADKIHEDTDSAIFYKMAVLLFSSLCYALAASLAYEMYTSTAGSQFFCLVVAVSIIIAIHNMMWMAHEGIISDCAFCSLMAICVLYVMSAETQQLATPLPQPTLWKSASISKSSMANIIFWVFKTSSVNAERSIAYLQRFFSPAFLGLLSVRLYSILFIANKVTRNFFTDTPGDPPDVETVLKDFEDTDRNPWRSPLLLKVSIIFMLTQFTAHSLGEWSGGYSWWPTQVLLSRMTQILCVNAFYMWRLYRADDWTWNPWLTP